MSYESPILVLAQRMCEDYTQKVDAYIFREVRKVGVEVDKEELLKALKYYRGQYEKGYRDGRAYKPPIETNYDRLVSKSPEELAEWLEQNTPYQNGDMPWEYWLKQEVKE